ncbi:hypothetical protein SAMN02745163_04561 [Clostridium cavendishii DSM 21758]|uniref:Nitroimidazol reductase NimA, pyridoxamine 5'-phosphate oxidase superfamily n=1 Tax=Clostridium cavendishii DSM 21758 TaxID=1121302 RepID=A0A1M6VS47_9CLOT|nr:pyridoxamine 5'-phosphate oxidase family protein [Clostridium cavendishii]SHK84357.1 hypothetical protein SAMN02745163_04561 [Clostridium cavendishii DSM 21758]
MFKEMRKKERQLASEEVIENLNKGEYGVLATVNDDGYPYSIPLSYVYHKGNIYFHCAIEGQKLNNIKRNSKVSFCITTDTEILPSQFSTKYKSVVIFGNAEEVFEVEKEEALLALIEKYSGEFLEQGKKYISAAKDKTKVIRIKINHISGKGRK